MASVKAKPDIATLNDSWRKEGFLEIPIINEPETVPIPAPAPANPIAAAPPPIFLAASRSIKYLFFCETPQGKKPCIIYDSIIIYEGYQGYKEYFFLLNLYQEGRKNEVKYESPKNRYVFFE